MDINSSLIENFNYALINLNYVMIVEKDLFSITGTHFDHCGFESPL